MTDDRLNASLDRATYYAEQLGRAEALIEGLIRASGQPEGPLFRILLDSAKRWLNDQDVRLGRDMEKMRALLDPAELNQIDLLDELNPRDGS